MSGMSPRRRPSAATLKTKLGPRRHARPPGSRAARGRRRAASGRAVPRAARRGGAGVSPPPRLPRAATRAAISASCGAPFPGSPTSPFAGRGGRANPKNASCVGGVRARRARQRQRHASGTRRRSRILARAGRVVVMRSPEHRAEVVVDAVDVVRAAADENQRLESAKRHQVAERHGRRQRVAVPRFVIDLQLPEKLKLRQVLDRDVRIDAHPRRALRIEPLRRPVRCAARLSVKEPAHRRREAAMCESGQRVGLHCGNPKQ